tara:strand:- start:3624 stop:4718 length:1095 start_codon:yes stop_codon:yes gene_type:complete
MSLVPDYIKNLSPYKAGKPISEVQRELGIKNVIKLASNENPLGPSKNVINAIQSSLLDIALYPDPNGFYLRQKLADMFDLNLRNVVLGAGSEGIMATIMRTFLNSGDHILATKNSFIGFKVLANASGRFVEWVPMKEYQYDLKAMAQKINNNTKIIYLANPDNPTGSYFNKADFDEFMEKVPNRALVILDEAYFEYATCKDDYPDSMNYRYDNVITLRTFSKAYGLAGLRIGYGFAHENLISNLMKVKLPFEPSIPAQVAAIAAIDDSEYLNSTLNLNKEQMLKIEKKLNSRKLSFIKSSANFITLVFENEQKAASFAGNFLKEGFILRHLNSFGLPECVRVTLGKDSEMELFFNKLDLVLEMF